MTQDRELVQSTLAGPLSLDKAQKFFAAVVNPDKPDEYRMPWCGRFSVPFGLMFLARDGQATRAARAARGAAGARRQRRHAGAQGARARRRRRRRRRTSITSSRSRAWRSWRASERALGWSRFVARASAARRRGAPVPPISPAAACTSAAGTVTLAQRRRCRRGSKTDASATLSPRHAAGDAVHDANGRADARRARARSSWISACRRWPIRSSAGTVTIGGGSAPLSLTPSERQQLRAGGERERGCGKAARSLTATAPGDVAPGIQLMLMAPDVVTFTAPAGPVMLTSGQDLVLSTASTDTMTVALHNRRIRRCRSTTLDVSCSLTPAAAA